MEDRRNWLIAGLGFVTVVLVFIAAAQALALRARGWRVDLGTVPDAFAAIGTVGALWVAALVWRHEVTARRADELEAKTAQIARRAAELAARADQARLVILEMQYEEMLDMQTGGAETYMAGIVRNLSSRPIFDVQIEVPTNRRIRLGTVDGDPFNTEQARAIDARDKHVASYEVTSFPLDWDWFEQVPKVRYTDASGVRWTRTAAGQPEEVVPEVETA
ncbi:hypothetical protein JCM12141A_40690 [Mycolicibacterium hodleri]